MLNKKNLLITIFIIFSFVLLVGCGNKQILESSQLDLKEETTIEEKVKSHVEKENNDKELLVLDKNNEDKDNEKEVDKKEEQEDVNKEKELEVKKEEVVVKQETKTDVVKKEEPKKAEVKKEGSKKAEAKKEVKKKETEKKSSNFTGDPINKDFMAKEPLNVRTGPGTNNDLFGQLKPGEKVTVISKETVGGNEWFEVIIFGDITGWVSASYLFVYDPNYKINLEKEEKEKNKNLGYKPDMIYFNGKSVPYKNGGVEKGQAIIDTNGGYTYASTWGGVAVFNGNDGKNTNFIGHSPGVFEGIEKAKIFVVTDSKGNPFTYEVTEIFKAHKDSYMTNDGVYKRDWLFGTGGGERITIQTCVINEDNNWLIEARPK